MSAKDRVISSFLRAVLLQMKALGLNQTSLARRLNVSRPYVTKVLHGDVNITFGAALRLAKALEMDFRPMLRERTNASGETRTAESFPGPSEAYRRVHLAVAGIERGAKLMGITGCEMHDRLKARDLISRFLFGQYEPLHTQSYDYVAEASVDALRHWESAT